MITKKSSSSFSMKKDPGTTINSKFANPPNLMSNLDDERYEQELEAKLHSAFSKRLYLYIWIFALLILVPFEIPLLVVYLDDSKYYKECRPNSSVAWVMILIPGLLHTFVALTYSILIFKNRNHSSLATRGRYFLWQVVITVPLIMVMSVTALLAFFGLLTNECTYTYNANWEDAENETVENYWGDTIYLRISLDLLVNMVALFFFCAVNARQYLIYRIHVKNDHGSRVYTVAFFFCAVNARQYLIYRIHVKNDHGSRVYTVADLRKLYGIALAIPLVSLILLSLGFLVIVIVSKTDPVVNIILPIQIVDYFHMAFSLAVFCFFAVLGFLTRNLNLQYSDTWANIRFVLLELTVGVTHLVLRIFSKHMLLTAVVTYFLWMTTFLIYVMDAFTP
eukprot:Awhi_evm1s3961